jgi:hypothetical protein
MKSAPVLAGLLFVAVLSPRATYGQSASITASSGNETVTIAEPGKMRLEQLFKMADLVAVVRVVSGDTENYKTAVYKAIVVTSFKGTANGQTLYYGPFVGQRLGSEYVVFLRSKKDPAVSTTTPTAAYGVVKYMEDFNQGYTEMEISYECVFDGNIPAQSCDYGVRVCTDYITLPKDVRTFPPEANEPPFGRRWVRKSKFISLLDNLAEEPGVVQMPASAR